MGRKACGEGRGGKGREDEAGHGKVWQDMLKERDDEARQGNASYHSDRKYNPHLSSGINI